MKIDKIYVINLEHRKDRKKQIMEELEKMKVEDLGKVEIFRGIVPSDEILNKWNPNYIKPLPDWVKQAKLNENKYRIGALGCLLSHFTIIQKALANNYSNILIFEDDAEFREKEKSLPEILKKYDNFFDKIVKEYGIFYLGGNNAEFGMRKIIDNIYLTYGTYTTSSYIISKDAMKFVVEKLPGYSKEIDKFYQEVIQKRNFCFTLHPPLIIQRKSHSDITNKEVDYDLNRLK